MRISRPAFVAAASFACLPLSLAAQEGPPVPLHSRVRVTTETAPQSPYVGAFRTWDGSALVLEEADKTRLTVPFSDVERLELSRGTHGHAGTGAIVGFGAGVVFTTIAVLAAGETNEPTWHYLLAGTLVFGGSGAALGALVGSQIKSETWEEIPLDYYRPEAPNVVAGRP